MAGGWEGIGVTVSRAGVGMRNGPECGGVGVEKGALHAKSPISIAMGGIQWGLMEVDRK
jgi:hypothetical protein